MSEPEMDETEAALARAAHLAKHAEAARAGIFAAAGDVLETMKANDVSEAEACLMTGALEMAVQTWVQVAFQIGVTPKTSRETMLKEAKRFFRKHLLIEQAAAKAPPPKKEVIEA